MSIPELLEKLPNIAAVTLQCYSKNQVLFPLRETSNHLQMLFYWWTEAIKDLEMMTGSDNMIVHEQGDGRRQPIPPTLLGTVEMLQYIVDQLRVLTDDAQGYVDESALPYWVQYKVQKGYDNAMEALFHTSTAITHYETITRAGESGPGPK